MAEWTGEGVAAEMDQPRLTAVPRRRDSAGGPHELKMMRLPEVAQWSVRGRLAQALGGSGAGTLRVWLRVRRSVWGATMC